MASDGEMNSQALLSIEASRVNGLDRISSLGWAGVDATVLMELALDIFEQFCVGGKLGVKYEKDKPRTHGCKTALEVFRDREGDCNELTHLYISLWLASQQLNRSSAHAIIKPVDVASTEPCVYDHVCAALFIDMDQMADFVRIKYQRYRHEKFDNDSEFRTMILQEAQIEETPGLAMILIDLTEKKEGFGIQHGQIRVVDLYDLLYFYHYDAYMNLWPAGRHEEALKHFITGMKMSFNERHVLRFANQLLEEGKKEMAILLLETAISIKSTRELWKTLSGIFLRASKAIPEAESYLRKYIENNPEDPYARYELALILWEPSAIDEALEHINKALQILPEEPLFQQALVSLKRYKGSS
ncbi:MAG: hypothetical protein HY606_10575 [Planctomycetes bacterium]|nr:hypothetical protein [Planctomycetota bacterium]